MGPDVAWTKAAMCLLAVIVLLPVGAAAIKY